MSGYAYGEDIGYIDFNPFAEGIDYGVKIDENGNFSGWAYGESVGWISFNCANTNSCAANGGFDYKVASTAKYKDFKPTTIEIVTQPVAGGCSGNLAVSPAISVKDQWGDYIEDGTTVTASISGGTGQLLGTTTAQTVDGVATFANLSYSEPDQTFSISFSAGEYSVSSDPILPSDSACGGAEGFISVPSQSSSAATQNIENSEPVSNSGSLNSVSLPAPSTTTSQPSSAPPQQQVPSAINSEGIKTYAQEKIDLIKQNIPHGQSSAFLQIVSVLQQMVINLKILIGLAN
ncbi:MAG: hypothetical protein PHT44_04720 [Candidatus Portnoybacteria bacterium]|nr:hypothetical protein [Candidatus Portnoybacteria bacterium]